MEGILGFVCYRQPFFHCYFRSTNKIPLNKLCTITSKSYFKFTNGTSIGNGCHYSCSGLYYVFLVLFYRCLALLHKRRKPILAASR